MDSPILSQPIKFVPEYRAIIMKSLRLHPLSEGLHERLL